MKAATDFDEKRGAPKFELFVKVAVIFDDKGEANSLLAETFGLLQSTSAAILFVERGEVNFNSTCRVVG